MEKKLYKQEKALTLFISNEDIEDIIKIAELLVKWGLLIYGPSETIKREIKKQEGGFLLAMVAPMTTSLIAAWLPHWYNLQFLH